MNCENIMLSKTDTEGQTHDSTCIWYPGQSNSETKEVEYNNLR